MGRENKWVKLDSEYIIKRPWLTARRDKIQMPNGKVIPEYYVLEYPTWINIIALTKDGKMIMIKQYRYALGIDKYELCAGTMDDTDKSPLDTAKRELLEETGYDNGNWSEFMVLSPNPTSMTNLCYTFLATDLEKTGDQKLDDTEDLTYHLMDEEEVYRLLQDGEIMQALMAAPLWKYFSTKKKTI